jgi:hypothetical protein
LIRNRTTTTTWAEADPWDPRRAAPASACIYGVACTPGHCVHVLLRHGPRAIYRPMHGTMGWLAVAWCDGRRDLAAAVTYVRTCACGARRRASDPRYPRPHPAIRGLIVPPQATLGTAAMWQQLLCVFTTHMQVCLVNSQVPRATWSCLCSMLFFATFRLHVTPENSITIKYC